MVLINGESECLFGYPGVQVYNDKKYYGTVLSNLDNACVLEFVEYHQEASVQQAIAALIAPLRQSIKAVAMST